MWVLTCRWVVSVGWGWFWGGFDGLDVEGIFGLVSSICGIIG